MQSMSERDLSEPIKPMRTLILLVLLLALLVPAADALEASPSQGATVILADPEDPYYPLAEEIVHWEGLPTAHSLDEALAQDPEFLLWIVSPGRLSDEVLVDFGLAVQNRPSAVSMGIISGGTLENARALWQRAGEVQGERIYAANAANPAGNREAEIMAFEGAENTAQPLTLANLVEALQRADYLTFTGHGGNGYLALAEGTALRPGHVPPLSPMVIATGSCNTFRLWEDGSIALTFTDRGAAAYAGFAYSPNEGYLIGAFEGVPFRHTWPEFPIGHAVQVQNRGTLQGFAGLPYYFLLGDPRIALQVEAPYDLAEARSSNGTLTLSYVDAGAGIIPAGVIPVRIPGGAAYSFVEIPGVTTAWHHDPFYNARLQMVNMGEDKLVLFVHKGGDFTLRLQTRPPWYWVPADVLLDALDHTLLYGQEGSGDAISVVLGIVALVPVVILLLRKKASPWTLVPAALTGLAFAALHGLYALVRLDKLTITSKTVVFHPLGLVGTFVLVGCGAFLFLNARSWRGRVVGVLVAALAALAGALFGLGIIGITNVLSSQRVGVGLWNYALGLQPLIAFVLEVFLFGLAFAVLARVSKPSEKETIRA